MNIFATLLRVFFILLLAVTGGAKLANMPGFYGVVASYQFLPEAIIPASAWFVALVEVGFAAWLISGRLMPLISLGVVLLHVGYLFWLGMALARGLIIPNCGCFGVYFARPLTPWSLLEDAILLVLALILWRHSTRRGQ